MKSNKYVNKNGLQIDLIVKAYTRPNLRGSLSEMIMYMGTTHLEQIFDIRKIDESVKSIHLEYPERWTNILEQRALPYRIPIIFPNIEKVVIVTHSVYILQCVHKEYIGIYDDSSKYPDGKYEDINVRYCDDPDEMSGLYVATPEKIEKVNTTTTTTTNKK